MSKRATSQAVKQILISLLRTVKLHTREMADRHYPRRRNYLAVIRQQQLIRYDTKSLSLSGLSLPWLLTFPAFDEQTSL